MGQFVIGLEEIQKTSFLAQAKIIRNDAAKNPFKT